LLAAIVVVPLTSSGAAAATSVILYVDNTHGTASSGCTAPGSSACMFIYNAISAAESLSGDDVTIDVAGSATPYAEGEFINDTANPTLTVIGAGASTTTMTGNDASRPFTISAGIVRISGMTIEHGLAVGSGGAISNGGTLTLTNDVFSSSTAEVDGGALDNLAGATTTVTNVTFDQNTADAAGGAIANDGTLIVTNSTMSGNTAVNGGGIGSTSVMTMVNSTVSGNIVTGVGSELAATGSVTMSDDTIAPGTPVGDAAINTSSGALTIGSSIISGVGCDVAPSSTVIDTGYNVETDNTCHLGSHSKTGNAAIRLASSLSANGSKGPATRAIGRSSSAINAVPHAACTRHADERGAKRPGIPGQTSCDAGAFEFQATLPSPPRSLHAKGGKRSIHLTWQAPASNGGAPITAYDAYCARTTKISTSKKAAAKTTGKRSVTVKHLKRHKKYYCEVVAHTAKGRSKPSAEAHARTKR
jgi:predicted outer membrane repeat protein